MESLYQDSAIEMLEVTLSRRERDSSGRQPVGALNEAADRKRLCLRSSELTGPSDAAVQVGRAGAISAILRSEERGECEVAIPRQPSRGVNDLINISPNEDRARECLPRPPKERLMRSTVRLKHRYVLRSTHDCTVLKHQPCRLPRIRPALQAQIVLRFFSNDCFWKEIEKL